MRNELYRQGSGVADFCKISIRNEFGSSKLDVINQTWAKQSYVIDKNWLKESFIMDFDYQSNICLKYVFLDKYFKHVL